MAVPLRVLAGRRQLAISQASFLSGSAERGDVLMVPAEERRQLHLDKWPCWIQIELTVFLCD
jgi:hypothetical protein